MSVFTASSKPGRVITEAEREALRALGEHRETLKNEYNSRRVVAVCMRVYVCMCVSRLCMHVYVCVCVCVK